MDLDRQVASHLQAVARAHRKVGDGRFGMWAGKAGRWVHAGGEGWGGGLAYLAILATWLLESRGLQGRTNQVKKAWSACIPIHLQQGARGEEHNQDVDKCVREREGVASTFRLPGRRIGSLS